MNSGAAVNAAISSEKCLGPNRLGLGSDEREVAVGLEEPAVDEVLQDLGTVRRHGRQPVPPDFDPRRDYGSPTSSARRPSSTSVRTRSGASAPAA